MKYSWVRREIENTYDVIACVPTVFISVTVLTSAFFSFDLAQDGAVGHKFVVQDVPTCHQEEQGSESLNLTKVTFCSIILWITICHNLIIFNYHNFTEIYDKMEYWFLMKQTWSYLDIEESLDCQITSPFNKKIGFFCLAIFKFIL